MTDNPSQSVIGTTGTQGQWGSVYFVLARIVGKDESASRVSQFHIRLDQKNPKLVLSAYKVSAIGREPSGGVTGELALFRYN